MGRASRLKKMRHMQGVDFSKNSDLRSILRQVSWEKVFCSVVFIVASILFMIEGIEAHKTDSIIPATYHSGPMTGPQAILVGSLFGFCGIFLCVYEVYIIRKQNR